MNKNLRMTELEMAEADKKEARQEALVLRSALLDLIVAAETAAERLTVAQQHESAQNLRDHITAARQALSY